MIKKEMSKSEIEEELGKRGDFVNMGDLARLLKEDISIDMKKFVCLKLADIYIKKKLFSEAAKMYNTLAINSIAFTEKIKHHVKEAELYIKAGEFQKVDEAMNRAMNQGNSVEKNEIYITIKHIYKREAEKYEEEKRRNHALKLYERLMHMKLSEVEKQELKPKLLELYDKLGKTKEYMLLKKVE